MEDTIRAINRVCSFLVNYLPLANVHNTDFIVDKKWDIIPPGIAAQLEQLDDKDIANLPSCTYRGSSHSMQVIEGQLDDLELCPPHPVSKQCPKWNKKLNPTWVHDDLHDFLSCAKEATLPRLNVLSSVSDFIIRLGISKSDRLFIDEFMSVKKGHEIDLMTELCSMLAESGGINKVG